VARAYERALALAPDNPWYAHNLGHLYDVALNRPVDALPLLAQATQAQTGEADIAASYAHALARCGKIVLARRVLKRAIRRGATADQMALWRWLEAGAPVTRGGKASSGARGATAARADAAPAATRADNAPSGTRGEAAAVANREDAAPTARAARREPRDATRSSTVAARTAPSATPGHRSAAPASTRGTTRASATRAPAPTRATAEALRKKPKRRRTPQSS
jgi:hypothetical protein